MQMEQRQTLWMKIYLFLRNRDARTIELFFLALNIYILALILLSSSNSPRFLFRVLFQIVATVLNTLAITTEIKQIRMTSAVMNTGVMTLISAFLMYAHNAHAGTYALLALLAAFVCWKINIR